MTLFGYFQKINYRVLKIQRKVTTAGQALRYFVTKEFDMRCNNYINLPDFILPDDKYLFLIFFLFFTKHFFFREQFDFDVMEDNVDRYKYMEDQALAARTYLLKDPITTLPAARRKRQILKFIDKVVKYVLCPGITYILFGSYVQNVFQRYFLR